MFKIRNKDGLFSSGGSWIHWRKLGKTWNTLGHVRSHINQLHDLDVYNECELVEYSTYVKSEVNLPEFISECDDRRRKKHVLAEEFHAKLAKNARKHEYEKLRKEFG